MFRWLRGSAKGLPNTTPEQRARFARAIDDFFIWLQSAEEEYLVVLGQRLLTVYDSPPYSPDMVAMLELENFRKNVVKLREEAHEKAVQYWAVASLYNTDIAARKEESMHDLLAKVAAHTQALEEEGERRTYIVIEAIAARRASIDGLSREN